MSAFLWACKSHDPRTLDLIIFRHSALSTRHIEGVAQLASRHEDAAEDDVEGEAENGNRSLRHGRGNFATLASQSVTPLQE